MNKDCRIFVTGLEGIISKAIIKHLKTNGFNNIITRTPSELDLTNQKEVESFFEKEKPEYVFMNTVKEGGILENINHSADLIYTNLQAQINVIHAAWKTKVKKLLFLGSSCMYPKICPQPMKEEFLLTGLVEPTSEAYSIAKIAGIKMCGAYNKQYGTNFISVIPTNVYGPNDTFDLKKSHVLPALIRKCHDAKKRNEESITVWGSGKPKREFIYVDDFAEACLFLMNNYNESGVINVGYGEDVSIKELVEMIKEIVGFDGKLIFDTTKPDGAPNKLLDVSKMSALGWKPKTNLREGLKQTYDWFKNSEAVNE